MVATVFTVALNIEDWIASTKKNSDIHVKMNTIILDDEKYLRKNITTYLIMGIDSFDDATSDTNKSEQADFLALVVCDHVENAYSVIHINRDTMTYINRWSKYSSKPIARDKLQICLAYAYGKETAKNRCVNTKDAVQDLLYGLHIDYYFSMTMDAVGKFTEYIGGVPVTIEEDLTDLDPSFVEGAEVVLDKDTALKYVRARMGVSDGTNLARMNRQKTFVKSYLNQVKEKGMPDTIYSDASELSKSVQTNLSISSLKTGVTYLKEYEFKGYYVPDGEAHSGTSHQGNSYIEFDVDQQSIRNILKEVCYDKQS